MITDLRLALRSLRKAPGFTAVVVITLGLLGAWAVGHTMESALFGVGPIDVGVLAATGGVMIVVVLLAYIIPARRAAKIDPAVALRCE